ncbi:MAG: sigma-70 family RNA polymerase sigma factor [Flavobacteriales bacterium]|nr:sigma-70 family RNA polymerase sigma factor [Flavobacteriales bacterium]
MNNTLEIENKTIEKTLNWSLFVAGNNEAIATVYKQTLPQLLFIAYRYLNDSEKSKDVVSDVFEKLITMNSVERKNKLSGVDEKLEVFLKVIVKNRCINQLNIEKNRRGILKHLGLFRNGQSLPNELQKDDFNSMLTLLSDRQKEVLQLSLKGFKNNEIAAQLEISENTVKNTLVNSKKKIKEIYNTFMV